MATIFVPAASSEIGGNRGSDRWHVAIHVQADVIAPEVARKKANRWLLAHAGNLLRATAPELLVGDLLLWRMTVELTVPDLERTGYGSSYRLGEIYLNAMTGDVTVADSFVEELQARADAYLAR